MIIRVEKTQIPHIKFKRPDLPFIYKKISMYMFVCFFFNYDYIYFVIVGKGSLNPIFPHIHYWNERTLTSMLVWSEYSNN